MSSPDEWDEAIRKGPAAKRKLLAKDIENKRSRSKLPPDETERILALYEKFSLENFEISERQTSTNGLVDDVEDILLRCIIYLGIAIPVAIILGSLIGWAIFH